MAKYGAKNNSLTEKKIFHTKQYLAIVNNTHIIREYITFQLVFMINTDILGVVTNLLQLFRSLLG